jgi:cellulose synthase/poly-beta-1,6-N-acetylglucosamine synthase-like glycosyltransferase
LIGQHVSLWQHIVAWHGPLLWRHVSWLWRDALEWGAWGLALLWLFRISDAIRYLPHVALLTGFGWDIEPEGTPRLTVVVPARNEAEKIAATLDALMLADYAGLQVVAVDDRSTDATGTIMEAYALEYGNRLRVLHIEDLPDGWLGKVFALSVATDQSEGEYVL